MILRAVKAACLFSAKVVRGNLGPSKERSEGSLPKTNAEGTTPSSPHVSLQALKAKLSRNYFFNFGRSIRKFRKERLIVSFYFSPMLNALWCCVPDF